MSKHNIFVERIHKAHQAQITDNINIVVFDERSDCMLMKHIQKDNEDTILDTGQHQ